MKFRTGSSLTSLLLTACLLTAGCSCSNNASEADTDPAEATAQQVLEKMLAAYRDAESYSDQGAIHVKATVDEREMKDAPLPFSIVWQKPNKVQLHVAPGGIGGQPVGESVLVSDGENMRVVTGAQDEILAVAAPDTISIETTEKPLADSVIGRRDLPTPRVAMLFGDESLEDVIPHADKAELLEPAEIDGTTCWRVAVEEPAGTREYWIDQSNYILRRIVLPAEQMKSVYATEGNFDDIDVTIDYHNAAFAADADPAAYQLETTEEAVLVRDWLPPAPKPLPEILGRPAADFSFTKLDGEKVTDRTLAGKIVVLDFWATWCKPCLDSLPKLSELSKKYSDGDKVQFLAVNIEGPDVTNEKLKEVFEANNIDLPIVRDLASLNQLVFSVAGLPTTIILDADGVVQFVGVGARDDMEAKIAGAIDGLVKGRDLATETKREYRKAMARREAKYTEVAVENPKSDGSADSEKKPEKTAKKSAPEKIKLTKKWTSDDLLHPGNILVVDEPNGAPKILVHDGWHSVVELDLDGKVVATHDLDLPKDSPVANLRTTVNDAGVRYYVAFATKQKQLHLLDNQFKRLFSYPDADYKHPGIADVQFLDLDGDGNDEINVSYWGVVGLQSLSTDGKRLWPRRLIKSLENVRRIAATGADEKGARTLLAVHDGGKLATFAYGGERGPDVIVPGHFIIDIFSADLTGDDKPEFCALAAGAEGAVVALGIDEKGDVIWNLPLPGVPELAIDHVAYGALWPGDEHGKRQWVLLAPDSSLHFVSPDGTVLDSFNYGRPVRAVAVVEHDGESLLIVSHSDGVDAWSVDSP